MRALKAAELDFVTGGDEPGSGGTPMPNPFPDDTYGPPNDNGTYPDYTGGYTPGDPGSGWDVSYGNITISPGSGPMPGIGGDGVIVKFPNGVTVGVSTDNDGEPNGVKVTKPIW